MDKVFSGAGKPPGILVNLVETLREHFGNVDCFCEAGQADICIRGIKKQGLTPAAQVIKLHYTEHGIALIGVYPSIPLWTILRDHGLGEDIEHA